MPEQFDEYRLIRMLGRGNMGVVFLGHDLVLDRPVAIKFLNNVDAEPRARERFLTEARAAARIHHPNVMAIYRVGELEGRLHIIGEYIRGHSLADLPRPVAWPEALKLAVGLARGLACAHRQGVLHRDIKLANAMRSETGEVKLLDFSLAKLLEGASPVDPAPQVTTSTSSELDSTQDPTSGSLPRVTIDAGTRARRTVDESLTASPRPEAQVAALDSTLSRVNAAQKVRFSDSSDDVVVGTPYYMAPELWRAEPASRTSDVYALGVLLYLLCSGVPPIDARSTIELARLSQETVARPLRAVVPGIDPRFAEIVDRCLKPAPRERYASGDELCTALEQLANDGARAVQSTVRGNPYRGLQAFESRHRAVFFGRGADIRAVVDRLRAAPFLLVAGDSGVGKSSLCRAGALPLFGEQASDDRAWRTVSLMPGRRPLQTLVSALATSLGLEEEALRELFETEPAEILRLLVRRQGRHQGLVLFIDQLEELVTLAEPHQLGPVCRFLGEIAGGVPGVHLLATARGDFLTRVAALPELGRHVNAAIYLLTPLTREGVREAIVGPARLQDVAFESEALVEALATAGIEGNLPLLQFALAELWEARDAGSGKITSADLERIGRVTGALARHADNVVSELPASQRAAVRRLLMRLVTIEDTRASLPLEDLVLGDKNNEVALEALVRGRLVVAREAQDGTVYEIAHEALIRHWGALQRWISEEREAREAYHRLEGAALEWQRLGGGRVGLWTAAQLAEAQRLEPTTLRPREREFLLASRAHERRRRRLRWVVLVSAPVVLLAVYLGLRVQQARELGRRVEQLVGQADATLQQARDARADATRARADAFHAFDHGEPDAERVWAAARSATAAADKLYRRAVQEYEAALSAAGGPHGEHRGRLALALYERALVAEEVGKGELATELIERMAAVDDGGEQLARWQAPGRLTVVSSPAAAATLERYEQDPETLRRTAGEPRSLGTTPVSALELEPGSYRLRLADGPRSVVYPFVVRRGEPLELRLELPRALPDGFVYVPAGPFRFGSAEDEPLRRFCLTVPEHEIRTDAFLIARHETTYAEWIAYLEDLPASERQALLADRQAGLIGSGIALRQDEGGGWSLAFTAGDRTYTARAGEPLRYEARTRAATQDWLRMPVSGVDWAQAQAYAGWLDRTGRVRGARLCREFEWERAARGADGRKYPHGDLLTGAHANIDATHDRVAAASGPDEVGAHPASASPFGVEDLAGNVFEWTESSLAPGTPVARGGSFAYDDVIAGSVNRAVVDAELQDAGTGVRICAAPPLDLGR